MCPHERPGDRGLPGAQQGSPVALYGLGVDRRRAGATTIGLLSLRELWPLIGQLRERHDLNILGMEALAAATRLEAEVVLSAPSPRLEGAL